MTHMATRNRTISVEESDLARYERAAAESGLSFSAFMARAAARELRRRNGAKYRAGRTRLHPEDRHAADALLADHEALLTEAALAAT
jgi:hypothetical protein